MPFRLYVDAKSRAQTLVVMTQDRYRNGAKKLTCNRNPRSHVADLPTWSDLADPYATYDFLSNTQLKVSRFQYLRDQSTYHSSLRSLYIATSFLDMAVRKDQSTLSDWTLFTDLGFTSFGHT